jgi:hypothetical protein
VFTARYALSPYIKQIRFVFKGLNQSTVPDSILVDILYYSAIEIYVFQEVTSQETCLVQLCISFYSGPLKLLSQLIFPAFIRMSALTMTRVVMGLRTLSIVRRVKY